MELELDLELEREWVWRGPDPPGILLPTHANAPSSTTPSLPSSSHLLPTWNQKPVRGGAGQEITSRSRLLVAVFFASGFQLMFIIFNPPAIQTTPPFFLLLLPCKQQQGGREFFYCHCHCRAVLVLYMHIHI